MTYSVQAGFLSGKPPQGGSLNLNLVLGTAGKALSITPSILCTPTLLGAGDVAISPRVQPRATAPLQPLLHSQLTEYLKNLMKHSQ